MSLYPNALVVLVVLVMTALLGCSEDNRESAPEPEKEGHVVPVSALPEPQTAQKKAEEGVEEERPLRIGVIGPETGTDASYGLSVLKGVMAAAGRINAHGGFDGKEIEVLHYDNKGDPGVTRESVQNLIRQRVVAIFAAPTGWATFAPTHMVNNSQTIFISIGSRRRIGRSGPYVFRASLPDELATGELIRYATQELAYTDYALVTSSSYDYSLDLSAWFRQALAEHDAVLRVEADTYDSYSGKRNLAEVIDAIKGSPVRLHGVIFTGGFEEALLLAGELRKAGLSVPLIGGEDLFSPEYLNGGDAVRGTLLYATFSPDNESAKGRQFKNDYAKDDPDRFAALAYDAFLLLTEAIKTAGTTRTSEVREALITIKDFEGATGKTSFTSEGTPVKKPFIYSVKEGDHGERFVLSKR
jgi:branched-chain amino acid transport system substrate-binding protein